MKSKSQFIDTPFKSILLKMFCCPSDSGLCHIELRPMEYDEKDDYFPFPDPQRTEK